MNRKNRVELCSHHNSTSAKLSLSCAIGMFPLVIFKDFGNTGGNIPYGSQ